MIQIRRRWPVLAAAVAALSYGANYYQIGGIEQLRLERRPPTAASPLGGQPGTSTWPGFQIQPSGDALTAPAPATALPSSERITAVWDDRLSVGEKLAMWQDRALGNRSLPSTDPASTSLPISTPIPAPQDWNGSGPHTPSSAPQGQPPDLGTLTQPPLISPSVVSDSSPTSIPTAPNLLPPAGTMTSQAVDGAQKRFAGADFPRMARTIRVASFSVPALGPAHLAKPHVLETLVGVARQYDVMAIQGVYTSRDDLLPTLVDKLNQSGRAFDYLIGPRVGRGATREQFAILFDTAKLETDRYQLYTVDDPEDLMNFEPLVAWFRCKGVPPQDAFTFSLVSLKIDVNFAERERQILPGLVQAIRDDGRNEDDWIMVGDFAGGTSELQSLAQAGVRFALQDIPTNVEGSRMLDTILFPARATTEYTGRSGAYDFLRRQNLSIERALEISSHLPIWAEFSILEGAEPGRVAPADPQTIY